jgi:hypothetical protein
LPISLGNGIANITTEAELVAALRGWGSATPIRTVAAILVVCRLNIANGVSLPEATLVAISTAEEIIEDCFAVTPEQWTAIRDDGVTCGDHNLVQIASSMITMLKFIEGLTVVPVCQPVTR